MKKVSKRHLTTGWAIFLVVIIGAYFAFFQKSSKAPSVNTANNKTQTTQAIPNFDHIIVIVEENHSARDIIGSSQAPFINSLVSKYAYGSNYFAIAHPSLPNYIAMTSGTTAGIKDDCNPPTTKCQANVANITDQIEKSGRSWKTYQESMPDVCITHNADKYVTKHNPFIYYLDIRDNNARCKTNVVPFGQLAPDLAEPKSFPNFAFVTPNICNDMHDCPIITGDAWLAQVVTRILESPIFTTQNSLLVITWDESEAGTNNNVPLILVGDSVKSGYVSKQYYNHYSLLHSIELAWGLGTLADNDKTAPPLSEFFQ